MDVRNINKLFPKIDNLEHFPLRVLLNIFERLDYMDLYNLAEESSRFEGIVRIVLKERYSHEYLIIDETKHSEEAIIEFFNRFGGEIKAIKAKCLEQIYVDDAQYESYWIKEPLMKAKKLEKLIFEDFWLCNFDFYLAETITHLTFLNCSFLEGKHNLDRVRNLKELKIWDFGLMSTTQMGDIIRNNPTLEQLVLGESYYNRIRGFGYNFPFNQLIEIVAANPNQFKQFEFGPRKPYPIDIVPMRTDRPRDHIIDAFFDRLKHVESFGLSSHVGVFMDFKELLRRLSTECKSIRHLKLYDIDGGDPELFDIIRSFGNIETLTLALTEFGDEIEFLVEHLPFLCELDVAVHTSDGDWSFVSVLLRKCSKLQKLTINGDADYAETEIFGTSEFYEEFIGSIQNPNVKMEIKSKNEIVGRITKDEVVWRNKLVRWTGCDENSSSTNLLDLANKPSSTGTEQPSPFDLILGYLDLNSLCSLSNTSEKCSQLVECFVKQHSQQQGTFIINNEFGKDCDGLEMFAEYVTNLKLIILHRDVEYLQYLLEGFEKLKKLYLYTETKLSPDHFIMPQVQHFIYDGPYYFVYSQLLELSQICPDLEELELKQVVDEYFDASEQPRLEFRNLKTFKLKYHHGIREQAKSLKKIFKNTNTKLCFNV